MAAPLRVVVLVSGTGSLLQALIDATSGTTTTIVGVGADRRSASLTTWVVAEALAVGVDRRLATYGTVPFMHAGRIPVSNLVHCSEGVHLAFPDASAALPPLPSGRPLL